MKRKLLYFIVLFLCININAQEHSVLWLGTSIPEGCPYPQKSCAALGWTCFNKSLGSSGLIKHNGFLNNGREGRDLCETIQEKEDRYRPYVTNGTITNAQLNTYKSYSFENLVTPYLNGKKANCDIVVIDHGFNDRQSIYSKDQYTIDDYFFDFTQSDSVYDRSTYLGAFCYLVKKIYEARPNVMIVICSYIENFSTVSPNAYYGKNICDLQQKIAEKLNFPYLNMCDYNNFNYNYVPNTSTYISDYNRKYGTSYETYNWGGDNPEGNVTTFQYYCPDGVHPHTDKSGRSATIITENITNLLKEKVVPELSSIESMNFKETTSQSSIYDLNGRRIKNVSNKGIFIIDGKKYIKK